MAASAKSIAKIRKKKWVQIFAPKYMNHVFLGDCYVFETPSLMNRKITVNLMTITNDMKKQNINATFQVNNVTGEKAYTTFTGYEMMPSAVRRLIRRGKKRVDYTVYLLTKDNIPLKCNLLLVTVGMTKNSVLSAMRLAAHKQLVRIASATAYSDFAIDVINHKVQDGIRKQLSVIYPLKSCEVRSLLVSKKHLTHDQQAQILQDQSRNAVEEVPTEQEEAAEQAEGAVEEKAEEKAAEQAEAKEEPVAEEQKEAAEEAPKEKKVKAKKVKEEAAAE